MARIKKILVLFASLALLAAACGGDDNSEDGGDDEGAAAAADGPSVGLVFDIGGRGDQSFNDSAAAGMDAAVASVGATTSESSPNEDGSNRAELLQLQADNSDLVIGVGFLFDESIAEVSAANPEINFAIVDGFVDAENVASLGFAEEQGSFLVGAAAALTSETGKIGFIGGVNFELIQKFEAGFVAGAKQVNPDIEIDVQYITEPPDFGGFSDPAKAKVIATSMYEGGADVVFHAAGGSGAGLFEAASDAGDAGSVWAIGVDSDQYLTADPGVQPYILTSMLKRVDVAVQKTIEAQADGSFVGGPQAFDLSVDGVGYSTSGDFLSGDVIDQLEDLKAQIIAGDITVPTAP